MSDTPRTEAEVHRQKCWSDDLITIDANFACQLERELNAANDHIWRLEQAGDEIEMILLQYARRIELPKTAAAEQSELSCRLCIKWRETKEAKP